MRLFDGLARESTYISAIARTLIGMRGVKPDSRHTIVDIVEAQARATPHAVAFYYLDSTMTYAALDAGANRVAHWARNAGVRRGDAVALLMDNRPEYVTCWLGLLKVGAIAALINTNLRGAALAHSISIADARHVIVGEELAGAYLEASPHIESRPTAWSAGGAIEGMENLDKALAAACASPADHAWREGVTCK